MGEVIKFISPEAETRKALLNEIRELAFACNVSWDTITKFACGGRTWEEMPLDFLYGPRNLLQHELVEKRKKELIVLSQKKKQDVSPTSASINEKEQLAKKRYIRRVKMIQRDCEKYLPEFSDDSYRGILFVQFNARSSKELTIHQLHRLLLYMTQLLRSANIASRISNDTPSLVYRDTAGLDRCGRMRRIQALLSEKGKKENKYIRWSYALSILARLTKGKVKDWEDASIRQLSSVIAALSRDAKRKGRIIK